MTNPFEDTTFTSNRLRRPARFLGVVTFSVFALFGCDKDGATGAEGSGRATDTIEVVTTVGMIGDMAEALGGDCVNVTALMGPGVDPHLYRASAGDVETLRKAGLILYGGLNLEGRMGEVLSRMGGRVPTVAVMEAVPTDQLIPLATMAGHHDPHLWMDPQLWTHTVSPVADAITDLRPDCADGVALRAEAYRDELAALHGWALTSIATIPAQHRVMVTAHDAFSYFGRAFEVEVRGIQGVNTASEAGVAGIREVADFIVERQIPTLFVESSVNASSVEAVRAAAIDRGHEVGIGEQLFSDAMGDAGTWRGTYLGMIRHNVLSIVEALGGTPAPWPTALEAWAAQWEVNP